MRKVVADKTTSHNAGYFSFNIRRSNIMHEPAKFTMQQDNERTPVTLWEFTPDAATGWHVHEMDYVIVPLTTGKLTLVDGKGNESEVDLTNGVSYFRKAGVAHDIVNSNDYNFAFLEVKFK